MPKPAAEFVPSHLAWTTHDELGFLFGQGSSHYPGLVNQSMHRIIVNRQLMGLKPVSRDQVLDMYVAQLEQRRFAGNAVNVAQIKSALAKWRADELMKTLRSRSVVKSA